MCVGLGARVVRIVAGLVVGLGAPTDLGVALGIQVGLDVPRDRSSRCRAGVPRALLVGVACLQRVTAPVVSRRCGRVVARRRLVSVVRVAAGVPGAQTSRRRRLAAGYVYHRHVGSVDAVDADLVRGAVERLLARLQPTAPADERERHPLAAVVDQVVVAGEDVLGELDEAGEPALPEPLVGLPERRLLGVVLRPGLPRLLAHDEQQGESGVRRLVGGQVGVREIVHVAPDDSHDATVGQHRPHPPVGDPSGEAVRHERS